MTRFRRSKARFLQVAPIRCTSQCRYRHVTITPQNSHHLFKSPCPTIGKSFTARHSCLTGRARRLVGPVMRCELRPQQASEFVVTRHHLDSFITPQNYSRDAVMPESMSIPTFPATAKCGNALTVFRATFVFDVQTFAVRVSVSESNTDCPASCTIFRRGCDIRQLCRHGSP